MTLVFLKHCCFSTNQNAIREVLTVFPDFLAGGSCKPILPYKLSYYNHLWVAVWFQIKVKIKVYLILYSLHEEQQPWVQMKNNFLSQSGQLCYGYTMTKGPYLVGGSEIAQNYADVIYGWFLIILLVRTLFLFKSIWICPQGSQGWQKIGFFFQK